MRSTLPLFALAFAVSAPAVATEVVPVQPFRSVELRGGGEVTLVPGPAQRVTILNGSTRFTHVYLRGDGQLRIDACNGQCPQHYNLQVRIESPRAPDVAIAGGGSIVASPGFGPQNRLSAAIRGGGIINVRSIPATDVSAAVDGGGRILVQAHSTLSAAVHGGGDIRYAGNPQVSMAVSGGGDVRRDH